jgi:peptide/nickel transport system substrate-binding protein
VPEGRFRPLAKNLLVVLVCVLNGAAYGADPVLRIGTAVITAQPANPYQGLAYPSILAKTAIFDPLALVDQDGRIIPWLASAWSSENAVDWLITLRENVVFSNGRELDANALLGSVEHMRTVEGRAETVGSNLRDIQDIVAVSERQVRITLRAPDPVFPLRLSLWKIPEPETFAAAKGSRHQSFAAGTGPFRIVGRSPDRVILMANTTSWRPPSVERVEIIQIADQVARAQALASGDIDIALEVGIGTGRRLNAIGARLVPRRIRSVPYVGFALEHVGETPLDDVRVRRALNYAVNKQLITNVVFQGLVAPVGQLALPGAPGYDPELKPYPYDPAKARRLLAEAGYPDGFSVTFKTSPAANDAVTYVQQIAADLAAVGVHVTIQLAPVTQMTLMLFHGKFRAELFSMAGRGLAPTTDYRFRACLGLVGRFKPFFCDAQVNALMVKARSSATYEDMAATLRRVYHREHENPPGIFLWDNKAFDGVGSRVRHFVSYTDYIPLHQIELARD